MYGSTLRHLCQVNIHTKAYKEGVLAEQQRKWDEKHPDASKTERKRRPKYTARGFYDWAQTKTGPLKGKPYPSATVLMKVAGGLYQKPKTFMANKFGGDLKTAKIAQDCYTRGSLGTGSLWNPDTTTEEMQFYWIKSLFEVQKAKGTQLQNKTVSFKGTHARKFETLCKGNVAQLKLFTERLDALKSKYTKGVLNQKFPRRDDERLKKIRKYMLVHKYAEKVSRVGNQQKLIDPLQRLLTTITEQLDKEAVKQKRAEEAAKRVDDLVKEQQEEKARKLAEEERGNALNELQYMKKACEELLTLQGQASDEDAERLTALNTACGDFQPKVQAIMDSQVLTSVDMETVSELQELLRALLGKSSTTTE